MTEATDFLKSLNEELQNRFKQERTILSFSGFLERVKEHPTMMIRNAGQYIKDTFDYFGKVIHEENGAKMLRFKLFDEGTEKGVSIIGGEQVQQEIYKVVSNFAQKGYCDKLIMLHGPNGSAKTSMVESITYAMHKYSKTEEGAVYRFNWIFPTNKDSMPKVHGEAGRIGLDRTKDTNLAGSTISYAHLDEGKIASKLYSEFKENPIFLLPMPQREELLREWIAQKMGIAPADVEIPAHLLLSGLSKRNQMIFDQLLKSYDGDIAMVLRHVQIERFYYSKQYRIGVGTVEPQMSIDAYEKQLTMDKNIANLPTILHNISFHEAMGPLVEANRGLLEFSDLLKRPLETFKYLLSTVEKGVINLPSSTAFLDIVFFATSNEKHLDAFKTIPDFQSFRGRFELITVPYLLRASQEQLIYKRDLSIIRKNKKVAPHSMRLLALWTVLSRLKAPNVELYNNEVRPVIARLDPHNKALLYDNDTLTDDFKSEESSLLREIRSRILSESRGTVYYEGRYGASPREISALLYRAAQDPNNTTITPMSIFRELENLVKDQTVYEFLQLEPQGAYHNYQEFIKIIKNNFVKIFETEVAQSMTLVEDDQYETLLRRYIDHAVAFIKKESVFNTITGKPEAPSEGTMQEIERILDAPEDKTAFRESHLRKIAGFRLENPDKKIVITEVFAGLMDQIRRHYYKEREALVKRNYQAMLSLDTDREASLPSKEKTLACTTYDMLSQKFGYDHDSARECLKFLMRHRYNIE